MKKILLAMLLLLIMVYEADAAPIGNIHKAEATANVLDMNVVSGGFVGSATPADNYVTPTTAALVLSFPTAYDGTTHDVLRTAYADDLTTGVLGCGLMGWNGSSFDRVDIDANDAVYVNPGALDNDIDDVSILPHPDVVTANITLGAPTHTSVKGSAGDLLKLIVGVGVASGTAAVYNDADGTCSSGLIGTFDTSSTGVWPLNIPMSVGICVLTTNAANITVVYR